MRVLRQVCLGLVMVAPLLGQDESKFEFEGPKVIESAFGRDFGMMVRERDEYATELAGYAANLVIEAEADPASLAFARRALAVALHLSSRNRRSIVVRHQLERGLLPNKVDLKYNGPTLASLLVTRAEALYEQGGERNQLAAQAFVYLAALIDPRNEDAVFAYELQKIDQGPFPWKLLMEERVKVTGAAETE